MYCNKTKYDYRSLLHSIDKVNAKNVKKQLTNKGREGEPKLKITVPFSKMQGFYI